MGGTYLLRGSQVKKYLQKVHLLPAKGPAGLLGLDQVWIGTVEVR